MNALDRTRTAIDTAAAAMEAGAKIAAELVAPLADAAEFRAAVLTKAAAVSAALKAAGYVDGPRADKIASELAEHPIRIFDIINYVTTTPVDTLGRAAQADKAASGEHEDAFDIWERTGSPPPVHR